MKIKFATPEQANFTGLYGNIEFVDGVSVHDVSMNDVRLLGAITTIEVLGDDYTPDATLDSIKDMAATVTRYKTFAEIEAEAAANQPAPDAPAPVDTSALYTQAQLEAVADESGIAGVREIADKLNVRGTSITKLISGILAAQGPAAPAAQFIESPAEGVTVTITDPLVKAD